MRFAPSTQIAISCFSEAVMNTLVLDIGGTNVKVWKTDENDKVKIPSGKELTPQKLVEQLASIMSGWTYQRISIGYPGEIMHGKPIAEPWNLGPGWVEFDYAKEFGCPVRMMNDACMQALGSYDGGRMLYLGFGTGIGTAFVKDGVIVPLALGHLKFCRGESFDHYLSRKGLEMHGVKRWRRAVAEAVAVLKPAFLADYVVLGGGNAKKIKELPQDSRRGDNFNAYIGGLRIWEDEKAEGAPALSVVSDSEPKAVKA
jgi:hypothetical protein